MFANWPSLAQLCGTNVCEFKENSQTLILQTLVPQLFFPHWLIRIRYTKQKEIHFKEVRLSFLLRRKFICYWFNNNFLDAVTDIHSKNKILFEGIVVPKSNQHDILSNFTTNSCDVFRWCRNCNIFKNEI